MVICSDDACSLLDFELLPELPSQPVSPASAKHKAHATIIGSSVLSFFFMALHLSRERIQMHDDTVHNRACNFRERCYLLF